MIIPVTRPSRLLSGLAILLFGISSFAISPEMEAELSQKIQAELQVQIKSLLRPQFVCEEYLGLDYPVPDPTATKLEIREKLEQLVEQEAMEKYPESQQTEFLREARERFSLFEEGNKVELKLADGRVVRGWLRNVGEFDVQVDAHTIRFEDMADETRARFSEELSEARIERYVTQEMAVWRDLRATLRGRIREQREQQLFTQAGYIMRLGEWIPLAAYFNDELIRQQAELSERLRPMLMTRVYMEHGFRNYSGVWMTPGEIEQRELLEAEKNAFDPSFESELDRLNSEAASQAPAPASAATAPAEDDDDLL